MQTIFVLFFFTLSLVVSAQTTVTIISSGDTVTITKNDSLYNFIEVPPTFIGGRDSLSSFLSHNMRYPAEARSKNISGVCVTRFVVRSDGSIEKAEIIKGIGAGCDEEALRLVKKMPKWKPGMWHKKNVNVLYTLPIHFKL